VDWAWHDKTDHHDVGNNRADEVQMARRERWKLTDEYKAEVVALVRSSGKGIAAISRDLDLTETAVREWVQRADVNDGTRNRLSTAEREELTRLRRHVRVRERRAPSSRRPRLSSSRRSGEPISVHRGGEGQSRGQNALSRVPGLPRRLLPLVDPSALRTRLGRPRAQRAHHRHPRAQPLVRRRLTGVRTSHEEFCSRA
jgi:transposase